MSIPVKYCFLVRAADDEDAFKKLAPIMKRNINGGHFSMSRCDCNPPCRELSVEETQTLHERFVTYQGE